MTGLKFKFRQGVHWHESHRLMFGRLLPAIGKLDQFPSELEGLQHLRKLDLRLHGGARLDGCLSAGCVKQLDVAEGLRVCRSAGRRVASENSTLQLATGGDRSAPA